MLEYIFDDISLTKYKTVLLAQYALTVFFRGMEQIYKIIKYKYRIKFYLELYLLFSDRL